MEQNKIPTAEKWLLNHKQLSKHDVAEYDEGGYLGVNDNKLYEIMIEFAKLHVKASLEAAYEKAKVVLVENCDDHTPYWGPCVTCGRYDNPMIPSNEVDKESILNAYPENLIQ